MTSEKQKIILPRRVSTVDPQNPKYSQVMATRGDQRHHYTPLQTQHMPPVGQKLWCLWEESAVSMAQIPY